MSVHLQKEISNLKKMILALGAMVEESVKQSIKSVISADAELALHIQANDQEIDQYEVAIEEECLKVLALYQPVAVDLRFIVAILKINNDLERIGDEAVNIAERSEFLATVDHDEEVITNNFNVMEKKTQAMLKKALDALVNLDADLAQQVCDSDDEVDQINRDSHELSRNLIKEKPYKVDFLIQSSSIFKYLERIADLATNIAEDVIYMCHGKIVRHKN
ncbi:MAG: phosphate signaling complex protein PhoU [Candidatus Zixiibacteriota bacterium]